MTSRGSPGQSEELGIGELTKDQVSAYYAWKRTMNSAWDTLLGQAEKMTFKPYENESWFNELKFLSKMEKSEEGPLFASPKEKAEYQKVMEVVNGLSEEERKRFDNAMTKVEEPSSRIKELRSEMGRVQYYVPRSREEGKYVIRVRDQGERLFTAKGRPARLREKGFMTVFKNSSRKYGRKSH